MAKNSLPEYWLRGPVENIPVLLQPVAHALLQARHEINAALVDFPELKLWERPAAIASVAFHLQHITGVLDRLFTYANGKTLHEQQLHYLSAEGKKAGSVTTVYLQERLSNQIDIALEQLTTTDAGRLTETRLVGRKQAPSTLLGLLFHAAEHTMRHTGQLLVTIAILKV